MLLTEEEIVAEASKDKEYCQLSVDVGMWAAREQLKRVVDFLCDYGEEKTLEECWQALKKEVE